LPSKHSPCNAAPGADARAARLTFLRINGSDLQTVDAGIVTQVVALADGRIPEEELADSKATPRRMETRMIPVDGAEVWLFSYGTLRLRDVQLALFGRELDGRSDVLPGYAVSPRLITDPDVIATSGTAHHTIVRETGDPLDEVPGTVFRITQAELAAADRYEVSDCKRVAVRLGSGIDAFVYVDARAAPAG
jgi:hypothetical protein